MSKSYVFPSFHFFPKKLVSESKRIEEKYKDFDEKLTKEISRVTLPELLKAIRNLKNERSIIIEYAKKLPVLNIKILTYEYPYQHESSETLSKIMIILHERYSRFVGRRFWDHFHLLPMDIHLYSILDIAFATEDNTFLALESNVRKQYNSLFKSEAREEILDKLASLIGKESEPVHDSLSRWGIIKETKLEQILWWLILKKFIGQRWFLQKESMMEIRELVESYDEKRFKILLRSYIQGLDFNEFDNQLLTSAIYRLKDPRKHIEKWDIFSTDDIEKVTRWLYQRELISFFEKDDKYDRFKYWKSILKI